MRFHPNSSYIATGSGDKTVRLWSVQEGKSVRLLSGHKSSVLALAFSSDGMLLASSGKHYLKIVSIGTDRFEQTAQTLVRLLLKEQSDLGLHCLLFHLYQLNAAGPRSSIGRAPDS